MIACLIWAAFANGALARDVFTIGDRTYTAKNLRLLPPTRMQVETSLQELGERLPVLRTPSLGVLVRSESDAGTAQGVYA